MRSCVHCRCMYPSEHMVGTLCRACYAPATGPAPKEKEMTCRQVEGICHDCGLFKKDCECKNIERDLCNADLRALAREAYMAVLSGMPRVGMESNININGLVKEAELYALETVRRWPDFMAAVDALEVE